jgi:hypothetical protein
MIEIYQEAADAYRKLEHDIDNVVVNWKPNNLVRQSNVYVLKRDLPQRS